LGRPCDHLGFSAYSNPFQDRFRIRIDGIETIDYNTLDDQTPAGFTYEIRIYDQQGNIKRQLQSATVQTEINMANLPDDTYFVNVIFGGGEHIITKQVRKQR
jgi:hypothetical protein